MVVTVRRFSWAGMAIEFRGGIVLKRGLAETANDIRHESPNRRWNVRNDSTTRAVNPKQQQQSDISPRNVGASQSPKQAVTCGTMQLDVTPSRSLSTIPVVITAAAAFVHSVVLGPRPRHRRREENGEGGGVFEEERRSRQRRRRAEVLALRHGQDAAVADGAHGPENVV